MNKIIELAEKWVDFRDMVKTEYGCPHMSTGVQLVNDDLLRENLRYAGKVMLDKGANVFVSFHIAEGKFHPPDRWGHCPYWATQITLVSKNPYFWINKPATALHKVYT